ncbi:hypothetical protein D3C87_1588100 [compost metagenome]
MEPPYEGSSIGPAAEEAPRSIGPVVYGGIRSWFVFDVLEEGGCRNEPGLGLAVEHLEEFSHRMYQSRIAWPEP